MPIFSLFIVFIYKPIACSVFPEKKICLPFEEHKKLFDFTTASDWDCVAAVERLPALHYSVDFIFLSYGIMGSLWNFETIKESLMKPKWQKLASLAQEICTR